MRVDATSYEAATRQVLDWAKGAQPAYVCVANVDTAMKAHDHADFRDIVNGANLVTPDGMPLVWCLRLLGHATACRVYGPDLTEVVLRAAAQVNVPVGFYGGDEKTLAALLDRVARRYPGIHVAYAWAPPFRALTEGETEQVVKDIRASGARILFVGLGCPKQERWMAANHTRAGVVMLGVGAAFDFLAGAKPQAPRWMMGCGLEWLFRLATEPRRLGRRYLWQNPRFVPVLLRHLVGRPEGVAR
jgi:N-acetylglucosaminyldiphosphoundecaprenol N-acetyl-beta-D-mannosaminyltransferase